MSVGGMSLNWACKYDGHSAKEDLHPGLNRQAQANPGDQVEFATYSQR